MDLEFECPHCGFKMLAETDQQQGIAQCPSCQKEFMVDASQLQIPVAKAKLAAPAQPVPVPVAAPAPVGAPPQAVPVPVAIPVPPGQARPQAASGVRPTTQPVHPPHYPQHPHPQHPHVPQPDYQGYDMPAPGYAPAPADMRAVAESRRKKEEQRVKLIAGMVLVGVGLLIFALVQVASHLTNKAKDQARREAELKAKEDRPGSLLLPPDPPKPPPPAEDPEEVARRKAEDARQEELAAQQKKAEEANWKRYQTAQSMQQSQRQLMVRRFQLELFGGDQEAAEEFVTLLKDIGDEMDALQEDNIPDNEPATQEEWIKFVWVDRLLPRAAQSSNATLAKWAKDLQAKIAAHTGSAPELPSWLKHKGLQGTGTGFFVTENLLATNFHVVEHGTHFELHHPDGRTEPAEVVKVDKVADLAILRASGKNPTWLSVSAGEKDPGLGHPVFTIGFPKVQLQGVEPKYTDGKISALSGMRDDKTRFQISVPIQPGNSGGPLVDESSGWVLGVVVATLTDSQNVNYAVKGRLLYQMLTGIPEFGQFKKTMPALPPGNTTAITGRVKDSIVIIMSIDQANP